MRPASRGGGGSAGSRCAPGLEARRAGLGDEEVLGAEPGEVGHGDPGAVVGRRRRAEGADLDGARLLGGRVLQLAELARTGRASRRAGARRGGRIPASSSCLPGVSAPTADTCVPGRRSASAQQGLARGRRGHDQRARSRPRRPASRPRPRARPAGGRRSRGRRPPRARGLRPQTWISRERQDLRVERRLQAGLDAGPEDPELGVAPAELAGDHRRDGRRAQVRQVAAVVEVCDGLAGLDRDEDDRAVGASNVGSRDLQREVRAAAGGSST